MRARSRKYCLLDRKVEGKHFGRGGYLCLVGAWIYCPHEIIASTSSFQPVLIYGPLKQQWVF
jgi:cytosine/uracil/thiamine/allantoin permease